MKTSQAPLFRRDFTLVVLGQIISQIGRASCRERVCQYV